VSHHHDDHDDHGHDHWHDHGHRHGLVDPSTVLVIFLASDSVALLTGVIRRGWPAARISVISPGSRPELSVVWVTVVSCPSRSGLRA
jgi:hypothetical protein